MQKHYQCSKTMSKNTETLEHLESLWFLDIKMQNEKGHASALKASKLGPEKCIQFPRFNTHTWSIFGQLFLSQE